MFVTFYVAFVSISHRISYTPYRLPNYLLFIHIVCQSSFCRSLISLDLTC